MTYWTVVSHPGPVERGILDDLAPTFRHRRHIAAGVTLRYLEGGSGAPPVVLLHGRGHAATTWWPLLPTLAAERRVVAFDLPGFGHSASRPWRGGDGAEALRFFTGPIAAALTDLDLRGAVLVGHSLGGLVALSLALEDRHDLAGLVLIDAMGLSPIVRPRARAYFRANPERLARLRAPLLRAFRALGAAPASRADALRAELLGVRGGRPDAAAAFEAMCPLVGEPFHLEGELGRVRTPTLLLWGSHDEAFPVEVAERAASRLAHAEVTIVPAGHAPHVERPLEVAAAIEAFVARLPR